MIEAVEGGGGAKGFKNVWEGDASHDLFASPPQIKKIKPLLTNYKKECCRHVHLSKVKKVSFLFHKKGLLQKKNKNV